MNATETMQTSIVIAGKPGIFRTGIELVLEAQSDLHIDGIAETCEETSRLIRLRKPCVVVADLCECTDTDHFVEAIGGFREACPDTAIVAMMGSADPIVARDILRAGVHACITHDAQPGTLLDAVRQAAHGQTYIGPLVAVALAKVATRNGDGDLSSREYEVLRLLALGHTNREIAERLFLSVRTIESHRARLQQKLGAERRSDLVRAAHEYGLIS